LPFGVPPRDDAACPACGSLERHRLLWEFFQRKTDLFNGQPRKFLHIAPEPCFSNVLSVTPGIDYLSADLEATHAMVQMDITDIHYPDDSFDVIYCSHVLEHVPDDRKAMRELRRVLKSSGWAILQVPIDRDKTFEDWSITSAEDRLRVFGQVDHVRIYGKDYVDRLVEAGFGVKVEPFISEFTPEQICRLRLDQSEGDIFYCTKN